MFRYSLTNSKQALRRFTTDFLDNSTAAPRQHPLDAWKWRPCEARACAPLPGFNPGKKASLRTRLLLPVVLEQSCRVVADSAAAMRVANAGRWHPVVTNID